MTQRIFDMDNPQDIKDLFDILPDKIKKIMRNLNAFDCYDKDGEYIDSCAQIRVNWRDKTEITRPVDETEWIGCLCWFWDRNPEEKYLGVLNKINRDYYGPYEEVGGDYYKYCRPVRRDEVKFVEDME